MIIKTAENLNTKYTEDRCVNGAKITIIHSTKCELNKSKAAKFKEELNQSKENKETKKDCIHRMKTKLGETVKIKWESKVLHGQCIGSADRQFVGGEDSLVWLLGGDLIGNTGSEVVAAQDQELQTKCHATKKLQIETESKCRQQAV